MNYTIINADCFEEIKNFADNSIDLIITSPPYSDIISYGKNIDVKKSSEYVDWILPLFNEIYRVLKPSGSFILNINDNCSGGYRNTFIYELIYRSSKETKLKFYDTYIWHKKNGIPNGANKRFRNTTEFIFHFCKDNKLMKFYMDRVLEEAKDKDKKTQQYPKAQSNFENGIRTHNTILRKPKDKVRPDNVFTFDTVDDNRKKIKYLTGSANKTKDGYTENTNIRILPEKTRPDNVFRFATAGASRDNTIKHPAPFNKELPQYFINLLTDEGDIVMDTFGGIMTSGLAAKSLNRNFIGIELNEKYAEFGEKRINGDLLDIYEVCQYDMDDNLIACYKNRMEASKATGIDDGDIMRTYNRTKFNSRGGYKWKLKQK